MVRVSRCGKNNGKEAKAQKSWHAPLDPLHFSASGRGRDPFFSVSLKTGLMNCSFPFFISAEKKYRNILRILVFLMKCKKRNFQCDAWSLCYFSSYGEGYDIDPGSSLSFVPFLFDRLIFSGNHFHPKLDVKNVAEMFTFV